MRSFFVSLLAYIHQRRKPLQHFIFVLGHMRSGSSLLTHFLESSPDVCGYGESNAIYRDESDLHKLPVRAKWRMIQNAKEALYYVDQINHNAKTPRAKLLASFKLKPILIVREPAAAISSIVKLNQKYYGGTWSLKDAQNYYIGRLKFLIEASYLAKMHLVKYEDLVADSESTLKALEQYLDIKFPSYTEYKIFNHTGTTGDPSDNIRTGKIVNTNQEIIEIEPALLEEAIEVYDSFLAAMTSL